jgi:hypothetical protein
MQASDLISAEQALEVLPLIKLPLEGFEPSIPYGHRILSATRIPVPTQGRSLGILANEKMSCDR